MEYSFLVSWRRATLSLFLVDDSIRVDSIRVDSAVSRLGKWHIGLSLSKFIRLWELQRTMFLHHMILFLLLSSLAFFASSINMISFITFFAYSYHICVTIHRQKLIITGTLQCCPTIFVFFWCWCSDFTISWRGITIRKALNCSHRLRLKRGEGIISGSDDNLTPSSSLQSTECFCPSSLTHMRI